VRYIYFFLNTKNDRSVVLELPGEVDGASFFGTITDAWFVPLVDIGSDGADKGKGGKYLVLPPGYKDEVPAGYIPVRPNTYNIYTLVRSILKSNSEEDVRKGNALVKQIKLYPLSQAANPPEQRFVDMTDILYEGLAHYDASFFTSLARMLNEEPVQPRDLEMMGMLLPLGIEKDKEFKPDAALTATLNSAAQEAQAWLVDGLARSSTSFGRTANGSFPRRRLALRHYSSGTCRSTSTWMRAVSPSPASSDRRPVSAKAAFILAPLWTPPANRSKARTLTGCASRQMLQCTSSGL
jgi:hypothetical protein